MACNYDSIEDLDEFTYHIDRMLVSLDASFGHSGFTRWQPLATYMNLFATMVIGGLWHGASWNFLLWGALNEEDITPPEKK